MSGRKMHADELDIDTGLVRRLIAEQFPQWENLHLEPFAFAGTDNAIFRLGDDMAVRLPRIAAASGQVAKECRWLPHLSQQLPLATPLPLAKGLSSEYFPWNWSVCRWLEGESAESGCFNDLCETATGLAAFIRALQQIDAADGPSPGEHNFFRGVPLVERDARTRAAIELVRNLIDADMVAATWDATLRAAAWDSRPVWIHGDIQKGNLLVTRGRLSGVIDFGGLGTGDPACDLMIAWTLFSGESREMFRQALSVDDATWARGRGWALSVALIALPYYLETNRTIVSNSLHAIEAVVADYALRG